MASVGAEMRSSNTKERKAPKVLEEIRLREGENGGHIAEHHFEGYEHKPEPHIFGASEGNDLLSHIATHMHIKHDMLSHPEAEDETGGGIPEKK